jgi:hypothetical protein
MRALWALSAGPQWRSADRNWHACQIDRFFNDLHIFKRRMAKPNQRNTRRLRDHLLRSYSGRLCGFLQEAHRRGLKRVKPMSPLELDLFLRSARPTARIFETALIKTRIKANGEKRITLSPGPKVRTAQRLVGDVIEASDIANPFDYSCVGKGRDAAIAEIMRLVEEEGVRDFVVFDLQNYFTSVDANHLKGPLLPDKVIQHSVLYNRNALLLHHSHHAAEAEAARHGLPQGARVSGILASTLLGRELRQLDGAMGIVTYVDDGVIGACDPTGAKSLAEAIKKRLDNLPGGPLSFKKLDVQPVEFGFEFLGYWLRLDQWCEPAKVVARPSHQALCRFKRKLARKLASCSPKPDRDRGVQIALNYFEGWKAAYPLWQPEEAEICDMEAVVEIMASDVLRAVPSPL